jgi:hypothetical protein
MADSDDRYCAFSDPLLLQRLNRGESKVVVFIGSMPADADLESLQPAYLHVQSLQEAVTERLRKQIAQSVMSEIAADAAQVSQPGQIQTSVTAVLQLEHDGTPIDSALGQAIRLFPDHLLVHCLDCALPDERFFALGFRRFPLSENQTLDNQVPRWYEYRMRDYKSAPAWLNARFWANPERFDLIEDLDLYCEEEE